MTWAGLCAGQRLCWSGASACSCGAPASARLLPAQVWRAGMQTPEGSTGGPMKAKLRAGLKTAGGHSPRTPRGETPQGRKQHTTRGEQHTGKPTRQHPPRRESSKKRAAAKCGGGKSLGLPRKKYTGGASYTGSTPHCKPLKRLHRGQYATHPPLKLSGGLPRNRARRRRRGRQGLRRRSLRPRGRRRRCRRSRRRWRRSRRRRS